MLAGTSVRHSSLLARAHSTKHALLPLRSQRQLSSFAVSKTPFSSGPRRPIGRNGSGLIASSSPVRTFGSPLSARFLSSTSALSASSQPLENNPPPSQPGSELVQDGPVPNLADIDLSQVQEDVGFLQALGLDYGWGPSTLVQNVIELIHVYGGLPWVTSVIAASVLVRFALLKPVIDASHTSAKLQKVKPLTQPIRDRMMAATKAGDKMASMKLSQEMKAINAEYGIKMWRLFVPMIQLPIGIGFFRVLRGMGDLPVPSLEAESFLWLSSVTSHDPFFILPAATGGLIYIALKRGVQVGTQPEMMKYIAYIIPPVSALCSIFFPGILQIYFATTSILMVLQTYTVSWPRFRSWLGMESFPETPAAVQPRIRVIESKAKSTPAPKVHQPEKISVIDRAMDSTKTKFKDTTKGFREKMEKMAGENKDGVAPRLSKAEIQRANAYEKRRAEQIATEREMRNRLQKSGFARKKGGQED